jgi:chemotaxis protein MotA
MDITSLLGILLALAGIVIGHTLDGGKLASLLQPAAFAIVVVGTFGAVLLQTQKHACCAGCSCRRPTAAPSWRARSACGA